MKKSSWTIILIFSLLICSTKVQGTETASRYVSQIDQDLTLQKIGVFPAVDNMDGIYARPIEEHLIDIINHDHFWNYVELKTVPPSGIDLNNFLDDSQKVKDLATENSVDGLIAARLSKGPKGISMFISLYLRADGQLLAQEKILDYNQFELRNIKEQYSVLYEAIKKKLPYAGLILSRQQNRVSINLGKQDGIAPDQVIDAVQIIKLNRHPKFQFAVGSETEILGKIKILKVDDTMSFGMILSEKERGVIDKFSKIGRLGFVEYSNTNLSLGLDANENLAERPDSQIVFGKNATEWVPKPPPTFGKFGFLLGIGSFSNNLNLHDAKSQNAIDPLYPNLTLYGEMWLSSVWDLELKMKSGIISTKNPMEISTPSKLHYPLNQYNLHIGYNFLLDDFFGPKMQLLVGYSTSQLHVDDTSPTVYTNMEYSAMTFGLRGVFPVTPNRTISLGAELYYWYSPWLVERPASGGASNTVNQFGAFVDYKYKEHIHFKTRLDFEIFHTSFSNATVRNGTDYVLDSTQNHTTLSGGIEYLF